MEPQLTIIAFPENDPLPDLPKFLRNGNSVHEHATEMKEGLYRSIEHVLSLGIHREPLLKFLAFAENDPFLYRPNLPRDG